MDALTHRTRPRARARSRWALLGALLLAAGCSTFQDTPADTSPPPATIRGGGLGEPDALGHHREYVCFVKVDGKATVSGMANALFVPYPREIRVAAGSHTFTVRYVTPRGFAMADAWLDALPGRSYLVTPDTNTAGRLLIIQQKAQ